MWRMRASQATGFVLLCVLLLGRLSHIEALEEGDGCLVKENLPGVCKASSKCEPVIDDYIKTGALTIDEVPSCGLGTHEEIVCCPIAVCCEGKTRPTPTSRVDIPDRERPAMRACHQFQERQNKPALTKHILDGTEVGEGVYPHMAAIAFSVFGTFEYRCGGSLISSRHVLTAAHCVSSNLPVHVRLGALDIYDGKEYQDIAVTSNVTLHPEYLSGSKYYDIAVLELVKEATLNDMVYPACLALNTVDPPETAELFVAGWGVMNQTTQRTSKKLLRAPLSIVPLNDCNNSYAEMPNTQRHLPNGVIKSLLCAKDTKNAKADACQGDSGGPLILEEDIENKKYSILGIINSGFGCATKTPGLYTRVASFVDWIEQIVWPNNVV